MMQIVFYGTVITGKNLTLETFQQDFDSQFYEFDITQCRAPIPVQCDVISENNRIFSSPYGDDNSFAEEISPRWLCAGRTHTAQVEVCRRSPIIHLGIFFRTLGVWDKF